MMMNAHYQRHVLVENAKTHAFIENVELMQFAAQVYIGQDAIVKKITLEIQMTIADSMNVSKIQTVQQQRSAKMRSVLILASVPALPTVHLAITEASVNVFLITQMIHME
jgi:hypothetical protein